TKEAVARSAGAQQGLTPLASVSGTLPSAPEPTEPADAPRTVSLAAAEELDVKPIEPPVAADEASAGPIFAPSTDYRYFNGRLIRPVRTIEMRVTAYSPDEKSCGPNAKGITSSIHNVGTNAMRLAAADTR